MTKSEKLINALVTAGVIKENHCNQKAIIIARKHLLTTHIKAVELTEIAKNKKQYIQPQYED
jgi:hypothetical protein